MKYIVDMQGFKQSGNDFVLKELAIVPLDDGDPPLEFLFKEPFPWKRLTDKYKGENTWLKQFYHGISWDSGDRLYTDIGTVLRACLHNATKVLVMGSIKKKWLERFRFNVHDVTEMGFHRWTRSSLYQFARIMREPTKPAVHFITLNFWKISTKMARKRRLWIGSKCFIRVPDIVRDGSKHKFKRLYSSS